MRLVCTAGPLLLLLLLQLASATFVFPDEYPNFNKHRAIVGGQKTTPPPEDEPVAFVLKLDHFAKVYGRREGKYPSSYYRFYGIRYAEPPVGRYRFQRAKKLKLEGEVFGYKNGAPCPQPDPDNPSKMTGSEDCLFLNIFTPKLADSTQGLPVLLWIHGGGYRRGSAAQYGGGLLARRDVVVVTVQYRLGSLGFLSTGHQEMPGNAAMFDMAAAVAWVREYIEYFGGNPENIVPMGQGTGGSSAILLTLSNVTQARTAGVVAMSGSAVSPFAIDERPGDTTAKLAKKNNCPESPLLASIKCLQQLPLENLITTDTWLEKAELAAKSLSGLGDLLTPGPVVEHLEDRRALPPYLSEAPKTTYENPNHLPKIALLTGVTKHETAGAVTGGLKNFIVDALKKIPNYVDQVLVPELFKKQLKSLYSVAETGTNALKFLSGNYLSLRPKTLEDGLNQVIEATSDALFNFPAYQTSQVWSKLQQPTYMYSFDHLGKLKGAEKLLKGSLLVSDKQDEKKIGAVSHGTDLPYLFDIRSLEGTPDPEFNETTALDPDDEKVRNVFLDIITQFAKSREVLPGSSGNKKSAQFPNYISILPKLNVAEKFRECQMSLWSGMKPSSSSCPPLQLLTGPLVKGFGSVATGATNIKDKVLGAIPGLSSIG